MSERDEYLFSGQCAAPAGHNDLTVDPKYGNMRFTTPIGRMSYVTLVKPRAQEEGADPKFSVTLLLAPDHCGELWEAICRVADQKWPSTQRPDPNNPSQFISVPGRALLLVPHEQGGLKCPLKDGNNFYTRDPQKFANYRGLMVLGANVGAVNKKTGASQQPICLDENAHLTQPDAFYSGCYGRMQVTIYPYDLKTSRGVAVLLNSVQFARHGEKIGSFDPLRAAQAAFGQLPKIEGAGATPVPQGGWGQPIQTPGAGMAPGMAAPVPQAGMPQQPMAAPPGMAMPQPTMPQQPMVAPAGMPGQPSWGSPPQG